MFYNKIKSLLPGLALVLSLAAIAALLGKMFPLVGSAVVGILLGITIRWRIALGASCENGIQFASRQILQWSIVALGFGLPIAEIAKTGMNSLSITLATISAAFFSALFFGRLLKVPAKL